MQQRRYLSLVTILAVIAAFQSCAKVDVDEQAAAANTALVTPGGTPVPPTDCDNDGLNDTDEVVFGTDKSNPDTDGDGLKDGDEVHTYATNPHMMDTDSDGLTDGAEVNTFHTSPTMPDTDGGGMNDGTEVSKGRNPLLDTDDVSLPTVYTCH